MVYEPLYHTLHIWSVYASVQKNWKVAEFFFFTKDGMVPEANCFNSFVRILENAISLGKNKQKPKKPQELVAAERP